MGRKPGETRDEGFGQSARVLIDDVIEMMGYLYRYSVIGDPYSQATCDWEAGASKSIHIL